MTYVFLAGNLLRRRRRLRNNEGRTHQRRDSYQFEWYQIEPHQPESESDQIEPSQPESPSTEIAECSSHFDIKPKVLVTHGELSRWIPSPSDLSGSL